MKEIDSLNLVKTVSFVCTPNINLQINLHEILFFCTCSHSFLRFKKLKTVHKFFGISFGLQFSKCAYKFKLSDVKCTQKH